MIDFIKYWCRCFVVEIVLPVIIVLISGTVKNAEMIGALLILGYLIYWVLKIFIKSRVLRELWLFFVLGFLIVCITVGFNRSPFFVDASNFSLGFKVVQVILCGIIIFEKLFMLIVTSDTYIAIQEERDRIHLHYNLEQARREVERESNQIDYYGQMQIEQNNDKTNKDSYYNE